MATHLAALGYTRLPTYDPDNPPDVVVTISGIAIQNTDVYVSYPWWDYWGWYGWPCCYGPGWGVGYPVVTATQYDVGTIVIDMWDVRRADPGGSGSLPSGWRRCGACWRARRRMRRPHRPGDRPCVLAVTVPRPPLAEQTHARDSAVPAVVLLLVPLGAVSVQAQTWWA